MFEQRNVKQLLTMVLAHVNQFKYKRLVKIKAYLLIVKGRT